ncbi:hypothetical protein OB955_19255 [Halobacteria archaeon AArc-m2/3/4]|uniref:Uncharacterized protein n=1 Tax=Natronoglomus mannanivorans TaxID=2979990 RepID=A0ABT2QIU5_9EURY|nr:hypothetical protein [Halobacteria archaeon AArc-m2/3/4]
MTCRGCGGRVSAVHGPIEGVACERCGLLKVYDDRDRDEGR